MKILKLTLCRRLSLTYIMSRMFGDVTSYENIFNNITSHFCLNAVLMNFRYFQTIKQDNVFNRKWIKCLIES